MSEFNISYRRHRENGMYPDETTASSRIHARANKLLLETCIAIAFTVSLAGNIFFYTHSKKLQLQQDKHILQYDSLLSVKLLADKELMLIKARLNKYPVEKALIRILPEKAGLSGEKTSVSRK